MSAVPTTQRLLSDAACAKIDREVAKYPADQKQSAVMAALAIAQDEHGWLPPELIEEVARYLVAATYAEILAAGGEPKALAFIEEIMAYPDVPASFRKLRFEERPQPVLTLDCVVGGDTLSVFTTIATLGTPQDVTLQEVRIECFFPADDRSDALFRGLAAAG